jgi:hypothetical protein
VSTPLRALLLTAILLIAASAFGQINIVNFDFGAVRIVCNLGYTYEWPVTNNCTGVWNQPHQSFNSSPGFGWILSLTPHALTGAGLTGPNTGFDPPPFSGLPFNQAVFLQDAGSSVWQVVDGFSVGNYTLSFYLGSRFFGGPPLTVTKPLWR